jgi:hypothetical protein
MKNPDPDKKQQMKDQRDQEHPAQMVGNLR